MSVHFDLVECHGEDVARSVSDWAGVGDSVVCSGE